jgi:hypothetical protein
MYGPDLSKTNLFNTREKVFSELTRRGVATVNVFFEGGGDDGSVTEICMLDANNVAVGRLKESFIETEFDEETKTWEHKRELTPDEMLFEALSQPVYEKHGFNGDYRMEGKHCWDVKTHKVTESISRSCYESFDEGI